MSDKSLHFAVFCIGIVAEELMLEYRITNPAQQ